MKIKAISPIAQRPYFFVLPDSNSDFQIFLRNVGIE